MDRRYERDRGERGNWSREWGSDRNREGRNFRDDDDGYGEGQREFGGSRESRYGGEISDYPYRGRSSSYYGALGYRDHDRDERGGRQRGYGEEQYGRSYGSSGFSGGGGYGSGGYDPYGESSQWGRGGSSREFGDRPFRGSGSETPAYFGTGGYYGGFSGGNAGRDEWGGRYGEGRYRDTDIDEDRFSGSQRGESWRGREGGGGFLSRLFKRGPKGYARSDERIREDISERLYHNASIDSSEVSVTVSSGKVTLEGTVPQRWMRHAIENEADRCTGVRDIDNNIRVQSSDQESQQQSTTTGTTTTGSGSSTSRSKLS
jgi:hypothetical protein